MSSDAFRQMVHILLVDDDPEDTALISRVLERSRINNQVAVVGSGEGALRFLRRDYPFEKAPRPKLILLDLDVPEMGGLEVLRVMNRSTSLRSIPVLILSRSSDRADLRAAYDARARAVIEKPTDPEDFEETVKRIEAFWLATAKLPAE